MTTAQPALVCPNCERLQAEHEALQAQHEALKAEHDALKLRLGQLEARLGQTSQNSHRPPSTDPPGTKRPAKKKPSGRKRGGQPGHKGRTRQLLPVEQVTAVVACKPAACGGCGAALAGDDPVPERHQVAEVPKLELPVTEYQLHQLECDCCGAVTRGRLPEGVTYSPFGPRLQALLVSLSAIYRMSKRNVQRLASEYLGVKLSVGCISRLEVGMSRALCKPVEDAKALLQEQPVVHADETGWRQAGKKAWLWTAVTSVAVIFLVRFSRGADVAKEMLGEHFSGRLVTDRWSAYRWVTLARRQLCWAHLIRDFQKLAESRGAMARIGLNLGDCARELFHWWHQVRDGTCTREAFQAHVEQKLRPKVARLLAKGAALPKKAKRKGMCKALLDVEPAMWTFVYEAGVEPTNNVAERTIRHAVIWRRTSFGTQSATGSLFVERVLTTAATLRLQGRNVIDYLTAACDAANRKQPAPPLIERT